MGIQVSGCEIIGVLKKCKDADSVDSHHASLDATEEARTVKALHATGDLFEKQIEPEAAPADHV